MIHLSQYKISEGQLHLEVETTYPLLEPAMKSLLDSEADWAILFNNETESLVEKLLCEDTLLDYDFVHAGLAYGGAEAFLGLQSILPDWFLLNATPSKRSSSWKATSDFVALKPSLLRNLGGWDNAYTSVNAKLMDAAYRFLKAGARVISEPYSNELNSKQNAGLNEVDSWIFVSRHFSQVLISYHAMVQLIQSFKPVKIFDIAKAREQQLKSFPKPQSLSENRMVLAAKNAEKKLTVTTISAIIPTLNRYDYLPQAIESLLKQSRPPDQIIVIDQTKHENRQIDLLKQYGSLIELIYLDKAGQASARNAGIERARGEWILFFDDDSVAQDGMIEEHIRAVELTGIRVSTGLTLAPWKTTDDVPQSLKQRHIANVLDTGNCLIRKDVVELAGCFDLAFDHGSGADNDLGIRLYLAGEEILFNPTAIRTHYKASTGGLRTFGAWWPGRSAFWDAFPQASQIYSIRKYYDKSNWLFLYIAYYILAKRRNSWPNFLLLWLNLFWKLPLALAKANQLEQNLSS